MSKKEYFKIQIPQQVIRGSEIDEMTFVVYGKLLQLYYITKGESEILKVDHTKLKYHCFIKDNRKLKDALNCLYNKKFIKTEIKEFPRKGMLEIELNTFFDLKKRGKKKEDRYYFAQLPYIVLERDMIELMGHTGVRLLYYYESYINRNTGKEFAYPSVETTAKEIGLTEKTVRTYYKKLEKLKFIKIDKHDLECTGQYVKKGSEEILSFTKYNNHYYIRLDKIESTYKKLYNIEE